MSALTLCTSGRAAPLQPHERRFITRKGHKLKLVSEETRRKEHEKGPGVKLLFVSCPSHGVGTALPSQYLTACRQNSSQEGSPEPVCCLSRPLACPVWPTYFYGIVLDYPVTQTINK